MSLHSHRERVGYAHALYDPQAEKVDEDACCDRVSQLRFASSTVSENRRRRTYSESEEGEERNGMRAEAPAERARRSGLWLRGIHDRRSYRYSEIRQSISILSFEGTRVRGEKSKN